MLYLTNYKTFLDQIEPDVEDEVLDQIIDDFIKSKSHLTELPTFYESRLNEGAASRILGGLTGLAFGKTIGRFLIKAFKIPVGSMLHKLFTSKLFFTAVGASMGKTSKGQEES